MLTDTTTTRALMYTTLLLTHTLSNITFYTLNIVLQLVSHCHWYFRHPSGGRARMAWIHSDIWCFALLAAVRNGLFCNVGAEPSSSVFLSTGWLFGMTVVSTLVTSKGYSLTIGRFVRPVLVRIIAALTSPSFPVINSSITAKHQLNHGPSSWIYTISPTFTVWLLLPCDL